MYQLQKHFFTHTPSITHQQLRLQTQGQRKIAPDSLPIPFPAALTTCIGLS